MSNPDKHALAGQKLVVIGGSSGIGFAVAQGATARGAELVIASSQLARAEAAATRLAGAKSFAVDVQDEASLHRLFDIIGPFDHLVITAGPSVPSARLADTEVSAVAAAFDNKVFGALRAIKAALPHLRRDGSITLTSGLLSRRAGAGSLIKTAMNAAIEASAKQLAKELAPVRVNVVSPGLTDTEAYAGMDESARRAMFDKVGAGLPVGRVGKPEDVAAGYLLAISNGFVTGSVIDIEGGGLL
ncbi:SDR family oxidoreductase [Niveibacterium sp. SC-1]|uniref:SDR family oxidoreductase n=1 Tax=Niveibacterium sp. SC-1 TaxID=3135646 RepID=UPI00311DCB28